MPMFWCCLLLFLFGGFGLAAQQKPDFSGTWLLQGSRRFDVDTPRRLRIDQPLRRTTALGESMPPAFLELTVERHFESGVRVETYYIGTESGTVSAIPGDGSDPYINRGWGRTSVRWEGDQLRIATGHYWGRTRESGPYIEQTEIWSLDADGRLLIDRISRRSDSEVETRTLAAYRRQ